MKTFYKHTKPFDWIVCAIYDEKKNWHNPEYRMVYETIGYGKYGKGEIYVIGKKKDAIKITKLINTFGKMLANGEKFMPKRTHIIWDKDGNKEFAFSVVYGKNKHGEKRIKLIPDFNYEPHKALVNIDGYTYEVCKTGGKMKLVNIDRGAC